MTNRTCIPFSMVNQLLDTRISHPEETLRECRISFDIHSKNWIGIDNSNGNFRIEEFKSYEECIRRIRGEIEKD